LIRSPDLQTTGGQRDQAILALLLGCGLRRSEVAHLTVDHFQRRDDYWAIVDLFGKGGHIRSVPVPNWIKVAIDRWIEAAHIESGSLFRCVTKYGTVWGTGITEKVVWHVVRKFATRSNLGHISPHDLRRYTESRTMPNRSCRCCFGVEFAVNFIKGFGIV
jgi:site-specific recombinase XerD